MKRFMSIFIIFLFLPLFALSESGPFDGIWIYCVPTSTTSRKMITYQVEGQRVYYSSQEFYMDGTAPSVESAVYSCEIRNGHLVIKDEDSVIKELYYVSNFCLSADKRKTNRFYYRALESQEIYDAATAFDSEPEINMDPCGKWSFIYHAENAAVDVLDYSDISVDLFVLPDGNLYMILGTVAKGKATYNFSYSDGMWIGDSSAFRIKTKDSVFTGWIDESGFLNLQFTSSLVFRFTRIVSPSSL